MGIVIEVALDCCRQCRHIGHSGSFTHGGARSICDHPDACEARRSPAVFIKEYPMYAKDVKDRAADWKYHWYNRIVDDRYIPDWCPLKHGSSY